MGEKKARELWTMEQLQAYLQLPRSTVYLLVAQKKIPFVPLGKHRRFIPEEVEAALKRLAR